MTIEETLLKSKHFHPTSDLYLAQATTQSKFESKKWGSELIICQKPHACKVMTLEPGTRCSNHFHREKSETFVLIDGEMIVEVTCLKDGSKQTIRLKERFSSITLLTDMPHTFYCPDGQEGPTVFIEASTKDMPSDNYRFSQSQGKDTDNR